jgi:hypothetical protein
VKTIKPGSELPQITDTVTIDGYSQPEASPNTKARGNNAKLLIELDGTNAGNHARGLRIVASNSVVKGLVINRFGASGIHISSDGSEVEGNFIAPTSRGYVCDRMERRALTATSAGGKAGMLTIDERAEALPFPVRLCVSGAADRW